MPPVTISDFEETGDATPNPPAIVIQREEPNEPEESAAESAAAVVDEPAPARSSEADGGDTTERDLGDQSQSARARDDAGRFTKDERHRAKSQRASADDVPRIQKITETLRETQVRLALKDGITDIDKIVAEVYPDATEDQRKQNRGKIEKIVARYTPKAEPAKVTLPPKVETTSDTAAFSKPKPQFKDYDDIEKWGEDLARWTLEFDKHTQQQAAAKAKTTDAEKTAKEWEQNTLRDFNARCAEFEKTQPTFRTTVEKADIQLSPVMRVAIMLDANGPAVLWSLSQHPDEADALYLDTARLDLTDAHVALVQRRVSKLVAAGTTGAAPQSVIVNRQPKPPTPVRTGPMKTGDELPDDDGSYEDHVKAFPIRRVRR